MPVMPIKQVQRVTKTHPQVELEIKVKLNEKQLELIRLAAQDKTIKESAAQLGLTHRSAISYWWTIRYYVGCRTVPGVVALALRNGWVK